MATTAQHTKLSAAQAFESILKSLGYRILLGGGGGATALGGPRPIKDLDFKMGIKLKAVWQNKDTRSRIIADIKRGLLSYGYIVTEDNTQATKQLPYVLRLKVVDRLTGDARAPKQSRPAWEKSKEMVEISLTASGEYEPNPKWESHMGPALYLHPLPPGQLILDKLFVFAQRSIKEEDKLVSDFEDLTALLESHSVSLESDLKQIRLAGYAKAAKQSGSDPSLTAEVRKRILVIYSKLLASPRWSRLKLSELRAIEVKFMIVRVEKLLRAVEAVVDKL